MPAGATGKAASLIIVLSGWLAPRSASQGRGCPQVKRLLSASHMVEVCQTKHLALHPRVKPSFTGPPKNCAEAFEDRVIDDVRFLIFLPYCMYITRVLYIMYWNTVLSSS
jgi:hypothetical protein